MNILERLYYSGFLLIKKYREGQSKTLPCRVVSIGNLTVGGTGKTPAAIAVAGEALSRGFSPVVLTRGYRGNASGPCFVTRGEGPLLTVEEAGDEPYLMATVMKGVPVVKASNRYEGGMFAVSRLGEGDPGFISRALFILDDGFQHTQLYRDRDVLLIDADDPFGNGRLLPLGRLREPVTSLERADIIVITKGGVLFEGRGPAIERLINLIRENNTKAPLFIADHVPASSLTITGEEHPVSRLSGKRVFGFCGIGNPESFRRTLLSAGVELSGFRHYRDHHRYSAEDIAEIRAEAGRSKSEWIVTTEKDIIKLRDLDLPENILIIRVKFSVDSSFYDELFGIHEGVSSTGG
ncbi:MAG: tetraacyldisaccharide 4'-kinase [Nitrospirae bacterium]|nr:MAG: tetraacyldisaccharide 4'-kinase [Nitrospirota bacterium]